MQKIKYGKKSGIMVMCMLLSLLFVTNAFAGGEKIVYMSDGWESGGGTSEYFKFVLKEFHKIHPDVKIEVFVWPPREQVDKMLAAFAAGRFPDVLQINAPHVDILGPMGALDKPPVWMMKWMKEQPYFPNALDYVTDIETGQTWGPPNYSALFGAYYNKDLFKEAGIGGFPETWREMIEVGKKFTEFDGAGRMIQEGVGLLSYRHITRGIFLDLFYMWGGYGHFMNEERTEYTFNNPAGVRALLDIQDLIYRDKVTDPKFIETKRGFLTEKVAMYIGASNEQIGAIRKFNPKFEVGAAMNPIPYKGAPRMYRDDCGGAFVSATSKHKEIAWNLVKTLSSPDALYVYSSTLGILMENREVSKKVAAEEALFRPFLEGGKYGVRRPPHESEFRLTMEPWIEVVAIEGTPVKEALDNAVRDTNAALAR